MEYKKNSFLITIVDDEIVVGEVTQWDWYSLRLISVSPYPGWKNHMLISSYGGWRYYKDLRSEKGLQWATWALGDSYKKAKYIYSKLDNFTKDYQEYRQQIQEVDKITNSTIRDRIKAHLKDHLFESQIFVLPFTELKDSYIDREKILEILDESLANYENRNCNQ